MPLLDVRGFLGEEREKIRRRHAEGAGGREIASALGSLVDDVVLRVYEQLLDDSPEADRQRVRDGLTLVAVGGFGRGELSPYSDVDLLMLRSTSADDVVLEFAKRIVRGIWDVGLSLAQNVATPAQIVTLAKTDAQSATALLEARYLAGHRPWYDALCLRVSRWIKRGGGATLSLEAIDAIEQEHAKFGSTVHLLEPDVKRSSGGLRDIHLLRWLGRMLHDTHDAHELEARGELGAVDARVLESAYDFLLRVRADLHFHAGRSSDSLTRAEQMRIARAWSYPESPSMLAVEHFMRDYFRHTTAVAEALDRLVERSRPKSLAGNLRDALLKRRVGDGIWLAPNHLFLSDAAREQAMGSLEKTLELAQATALYGVDLDRATLEALRQRYRLQSDPLRPSGTTNGSSPRVAPALSDESIRLFLAILSRPGSQTRTLRMLHRIGALEQLIPEFEHARCLLQFNEHHKYTVDEHTFVMIQEAEKLAEADSSPGRAYRKIIRKDLLSLAILLHDLGKGLPEDHSEVGRRIAESTATRFRLSDEDRQTVVYLVHRHLYMAHLAFHRDTTDVQLRAQLSREVGTAQMLRMLYVLTTVDCMAVGPGNFTSWKADLLTDLYRRTRGLFGEADSFGNGDAQAESGRKQLQTLCAEDKRLAELLELLPADYLMANAPEEIVKHLKEWASLSAERGAGVVGQFNLSTNTATYTVLTNEKTTDGIFYKICGALSAHRLEILSARIHTLANGAVIDQFDVVDIHHTGPPTADRVKLIGNTVRRILAGELSVSDVLWTSRSSIFAPKQRLFAREETRIVIDNNTSETHTVIDIFTNNRRGLLYTLTKGINRLGLTILYAKIATSADQVVDVFYTQEADGKKVHRPDRIRMIEDHLRSDIDRLATDPRSLGF